MSGKCDNCGTQFRTAEDYRDHLPCGPGAARPGCRCAAIMMADETRHFRGCPLREKFPSHEAEKRVELDMTGRCGARVEGVLPLHCTRAEGHEGPHWYEPMADQDEGLRDLVKEWGKNYATRIDTLEKTIKILDERTAYQSKCDANNVDAIKILHDALQQLEAKVIRLTEELGGAQNRDIQLAHCIAKLEATAPLPAQPPTTAAEREDARQKLGHDGLWPQAQREDEHVPEELSNKELLARAVDFLDGPGGDAQGTIHYTGGPNVGKRLPTQEAEMLATHFVAVRDRAWMAKIRREFPFEHDVAQPTNVRRNARPVRRIIEQGDLTEALTKFVLEEIGSTSDEPLTEKQAAKIAAQIVAIVEQRGR